MSGAIAKEFASIAKDVNDLYDLQETYPNEFNRAVDHFKGEMTKIYDFWKDVFGFKRGGKVFQAPAPRKRFL
jgi:hypothetical protein